MGSFGERLRREREMRGVSLDDIAEATKIGTRLLRALEEEHFELLPGGIFNKGFVRAYAKYLGLNEDEAVADYLEAAGESVPDPRVIAEQNSSRIDRTSGDQGDSRPAGFPIIPVLILLVVIAAGIGGWHLYQERMRDRQAKREAVKVTTVEAPVSAATSAPSAATTEVPQSTQPDTTGKKAGTTSNASVPANSSSRAVPPATPDNLNSPASQAANSTGNQLTGAQPEGAAPNPPGAKGSASYSTAVTGQYFEVTVRAKDSAWVSIKSDGKYVVRGIIKPPDVKTIRANQQIVFFTGNAGAVDVSFNGQPVALTGGPNQEGVLVINPHGAASPKPSNPNQQP
jgi:cytoskeleton protein RodZ